MIQVHYCKRLDNVPVVGINEVSIGSNLNNPSKFIKKDCESQN